MKVLALDLSTYTGFAHSCGISGVWNLNVKKDESKGMRLIRFRGKLNEILKAEGIDVILFETGVSYGAKHASGVLVQAELQGVLKLWCEDNGIEYRSYTPAEIKKHATGKGNSKKDVMLAAARAKWSINITDDNQADALWILDYGQQTLGI
jgi:Holliday junction resolvasome RuvABC endonuclease subunit